MRDDSLRQEVRFCTTSDGVRIAYATLGSGPPLVKAANWLSHLEFDLQSPLWRHWLRELSRDHTLIRYDERGCGLSDWNVAVNDSDAWLSDLEAVVDAAGVDRFALLGMSQGGPVAIEYAVRHPERVSHLILYGTYARGWQNRNDPPELLAEREAMITLSSSGWGRDVPIYRDVFTKSFIPDASPEQRDWFNELQRITCSPENAVRLQRALGPIDVTHLLPRVSVPTLVLHARGDLRCPFEEGRLLASIIPGSRFASLESRNHMLLEHEPAWSSFLHEFRSFVSVDPTPTEPVAPEPPSFADRLKESRVVQWGVAYLTAAWVTLQLLGEVSQPWGLPNWVLRGGQIALILGFMITLIIAWHHGRSGKQHVGTVELVLVSAVVIVFLIAMVVLAV